MNQQRNVVDTEQVVSTAPFAGVPLLVTVLGLLALTLDGFDIQAVAFAAPALAELWGVKRAALGPVLASGLIGMALGAVSLGRYADQAGRRRAMIVSTLGYAVGSLLCATATDLTQLAIWRFVTGIGMGAPLAIGTAMINEFTPQRWRSLAVAAAVIGIPLGGMVGAALAGAVLPLYGWQAIFIAGAVLPLLLAVALWRWLPESPRFLSGKPAMAGTLAALLNRMTRSARFNAADQFVSGSPDDTQQRRVAELLAPALRLATTTLWIAFFFNVFAVYVFFNWLPPVLGSVGLSPVVAIRGGFIFNLGGVVGALLGATLGNFIGTRRVCTVLGSISVIATWLIGQNQVFGAGAVPEVNHALIWMMALAGFGISGLQTQLYVLAAHAFPTALRALGSGSCGAIGRVGGILSTAAGAVMFHFGLSGGRFFAGLALLLVVTLVTLQFFNRHIRPLPP